MVDQANKEWMRYVATHSPVSYYGAGELYAFAQAHQIDRDVVIETALNTRGNVGDIIHKLLQKQRLEDSLLKKELEEITENELWVDDSIVGKFMEYEICIHQNHIDKTSVYETAIRIIPTTIDRYIDIKFVDKNVYKYIYGDDDHSLHTPFTLLKRVDTLLLKSPGKIITATGVEIVNRTPSMNEVRCNCETIKMCCI